MYTLLAADNGWIFTLFATVRSKAISTASASIKLAMGIACIIVVFKMIRLSYDIMSDDKQGGFGGVHLWTILRPVLLLVLLQSCTLWVGALDGLTNVVSTSISRTVDAIGDKAQLVDVVKKDEIVRDAISADGIKAIDAQARKEFQEYLEQTRSYDGPASWVADVYAWVADFTGGEKRAAKIALKNYLTENDVDPGRNGKVVRKALNKFVNVSTKTAISENGDYIIDIHDDNIIPMICNWLYEKLYIVIQCFAEIILVILAMCSPWVVVISLLEPWKGALFGFIAAYLQVSFWKVVAAMINFATISFRMGAVKIALDGAANNLENAAMVAKGAQLTGDAAVGNTGTAILLSAIVSIAGVFALMKVADIAAAIIPSANNIGTASGGAGGGMAPVSGAIGATKSAVKGAVGHVANAPSAKSQQKQADRIGEAVASRLKGQN